MRFLFLPAILLVALLAVISLFLGVTDISPLAIVTGTADPTALLVLTASRLPRTIALIFAGASMAVAGTIMQMMARNKFVEPSTAGTVESATLGMLVVLLVAPGLPVLAKMLVAAAFALAGTALFLFILSRIPLRSPLMVPLIGILLGGVIGAATSFIAYRYDMIQTVAAWTSGDFSAVLRGRYEVLWVAAFLTVASYFAADRFTVAGAGEAFATSLGLNYRQTIGFGLLIVALTTASVVVTAGMIPFVGLIIPNVVSQLYGDNLRRSLPWIALSGAGLVLVSDMIGRVVNAPFEVPVGTILGIVGSLFFLYLLLGRSRRVA